MNRLNMTYQFQEETEVLLEEVVDLDSSDLIVYNDDVNTFDHVANILVKVCKHSPEQAEQCTLIIHFKGKCAVKKGSIDELKPMCEAILDAGIQAAIV
ncbi:ATP-dependent Clp protease adaptor protein ClpS [Algoriphagus iocasae]|jgi:ATP-dependent Clp protease adaptor protein ClpS|uniref:ATP-dependent Clp protease adaptor protein ClpS n=1 Tax=Algoriphagus iocasae TaxID=1836499 RepID=A0A841MSR8_9BACT|nr:ATP-dependent Clp protease adaptor ClpS [Algoriphagus iocasae]MBB6327176.1 ATP-dependent Clp protease adaptor protein ClpS [Algoriphagus iocasae]